MEAGNNRTNKVIDASVELYGQYEMSSAEASSWIVPRQSDECNRVIFTLLTDYFSIILHFVRQRIDHLINLPWCMEMIIEVIIEMYRDDCTQW